MPEIFRSVVPWITASWFISGILYASLYWWGFGIVIPSFLSLDTAGAYAIVPLTALIPTLLGYLPAMLTWRWLPYGGGAKSPYAAATRRYWPLQMVPIYLLGIWYVVHLYQDYLLFVVIPGLMGFAATPFNIALIDRGALRAISPIELRSMLLNIIIMMPPCAALLGLNHGAVIRNGGTKLFLARPVLQDADTRRRYVGQLGNYFVFYSPDTERVILRRADAVDILELSPIASQED